MKKIYLQIWEKAKPYYEKGRPMDIPHIEWMTKTAEMICKIENIDDSLLIPLAILHDIGYSELQDIKNANYYNQDIRKLHMLKGAKIAQSLLLQLIYPAEKTKKIVYYVSVHDNWALGEVDLYIKDNVLGIFKDLDYLWLYTKQGCQIINENILHKNKQELLEFLKAEASPIAGKKPFSCKTTKELHQCYLKEREKELSKKD